MQPIGLRAAVGSFEAAVQSVFNSAMRLAAPSPKQSITEHERGRALIILI